MQTFVHLRVHTEYSLADSVITVPALADAVRDARMPAVAMTDDCNVFALVKFYRAAVARGVQPIVGADIWVTEGPDDRNASRATVLCIDRSGIRQLEPSADAKPRALRSRMDAPSYRRRSS